MKHISTLIMTAIAAVSTSCSSTQTSERFGPPAPTTAYKPLPAVERVPGNPTINWYTLGQVCEKQAALLQKDTLFAQDIAEGKRRRNGQ